MWNTAKDYIFPILGGLASIAAIITLFVYIGNRKKVIQRQKGGDKSTNIQIGSINNNR